MAGRKKYFSALKNSLRSLIFYGLWMAPLFLFYQWHWNLTAPFLHNLADSPWKFVVMAVGWWGLSWLTMYGLQCLWPVLILIFYRTERERSPKKIIGIGDRFRKMGLSAPQIFILMSNTRVWKNKIWGFFSLPSPLGALMLIDSRISKKLSVEMLDMWICRKVIESRFSRFSSARFQFFSMVPTFALLGAAIGFAGSGHDDEAALAAAAFFAVAGTFLWRTFQVQRLHEIDRKTVSDFHLDAEAYFASLAETEHFDPTLNIAKKFLGYNFVTRRAAMDQTSWYRPWIMWTLQPAILASLAMVFLLQTPMAELNTTLTAKVNPKVAAETPVTPVAVAEATPVVVAPPPAPLPPPAPNLSELSQAVQSGDMRSVIHLLGSGKNIHAGDPAVNGATPLMLATKKGDLEMAYFLMAMGANPQVEFDNAGQTVLFYAMESSNRVVALNYMLRSRVDAEKKSNDGLTALDYAKKNGWIDAVEALSNRAPASASPPK